MKEKLDVLKENFDILKDSAKRSDDVWSLFFSIGENIIVPMLKLSFEDGCEAWLYMLKRYEKEKKVSDVNYYILTDHMVEILDYQTAEKVFSEYDSIAEYVFKLDRHNSHLYCDRFIGDLICHHNYELADRLITYLFENNRGDNRPQTNLFDVLHQSITKSEARWQMTPEDIDFLNNWIEKVRSKTKRAQLEVELLELAECIAGNTPKGAIPFSMISNGEIALTSLIDQSTHTPEAFPEIIGGINRKQSVKAVHAKVLKREVDKPLLEDAMQELDSLVGLESVKEEVKSLYNLMLVQQMRAERNLSTPEQSLHLVFSGNPGTGKTTVARIIGKIYLALGFLSNEAFIEANRSSLVAGYVGQTAMKTQETINQALGGVLFIDEAYNLTQQPENDYGHEAITTLLKAMEDYRNSFVVIVAGYPDLMDNFIKSNPGLKSRFSKTIIFPDYNGTELLEIFVRMATNNNYIVEKAALKQLSSYFEDIYNNNSI